MSANILIVEDDNAIATGLAVNLRLSGYDPLTVADGEQALLAIDEQQPDLIILDINLPKQDGISVLSEIRKSGNHTPVIVLSARQDEYDKVAALRLGADDYVTKPFALAELLARVDAVLRRSGKTRGTSVDAVTRFSDVVVDFATRQVHRGDREVKLTHLEFELLSFLLRNPYNVFSREQLLREVWGIKHSGSPRTVDNFVAQLRSKLERDPDCPVHFITVRGAGYRFEPSRS